MATAFHPMHSNYVEEGQFKRSNFDLRWYVVLLVDGWNEDDEENWIDVNGLRVGDDVKFIVLLFFWYIYIYLNINLYMTLMYDCDLHCVSHCFAMYIVIRIS